MNLEGKDEQLLRNYLLGKMNEPDQQALEAELLSDDEFVELLLSEEDELVDDYLSGDLSEEERRLFDSNFMVTPERRRKLKFGEGLKRQQERVLSPEGQDSLAHPESPTTDGTATDTEEPPLRLVPLPELPNRIPPTWWTSSTPYLKLAAAAVIVIGAALGIQRQFFAKSEIDKGISALARAYPIERPNETRLTGFDYARYSSARRGEEPQSVDANSLLLAEATLLNEVANHPTPAAHHALGKVYLTKRNYQAAVDHFEEAAKAEPDNAKFESDYGAALLEMGKAESDSGKGLEIVAQACEHLKRATALDEALLEALFNLALCHSEMKLYDQAEDDWRRYLEKDPGSKWSDEVRQRLTDLEQRKQRTLINNDKLFDEFVSAYRSGDDARAWQAFRRSRSRKGNLITSRLVDSYLEKLAAEQSVGYLQMISYAAELEEKNVQDEFTRDLAAYYESAAQSRGPALIKARNAIKSASDAYEKEEYGESSELYAIAAQLFNQAGDYSEAILCDFWTAVGALRTDSRKSLDILEPLAKTCEDRGYRYLQAQALLGIADAKSNLRLLSESNALAERTYRLSEQLQDPNGMLRSLLTPVLVYQRLGQYHRSLGYVSRAFEIATQFSPEAHEIWPVYYQAALNVYSLGRLEASLEYQHEALRLAFESNLPFLKSRSFARLGLIYNKLQRPDDAIKNGELALEEAKRIRDPQSRDNITANSSLALAHMYRQHGDPTRALSLYDSAIELHRGLKIETYLYEAHQGKLAALAGLNDDSATQAEIKTAVQILEQYRAVISEDSNRNTFFDLAQGIYDTAIDFSYERLQRPEVAFQYAEASHARSLLDLMRMEGNANSNAKTAVTKSLTLGQIWERMPADSQILVFSVLDKRTLGWIISKGTIDCRETSIGASVLNDRVLRFRELIDRSGEIEPLRQVARELYELLLSRVEPLLKPNNYLCIVPDHILAYLPFNALISPATGKYLVEDWRIGLAPSVTIFIESTEDARRKSRIEPERFLGVGNPSFDRTRFRDLGTAADEVSNIARFYTAPVSLYRQQAAEVRVKAEMKHADVIEFATHYVVDRDSPLQSCLLMAREEGNSQEDGYLSLSEIYDMALPRTRLVVLSACQTGVERTYRGEGAISAARPFLRARVPVVVASLWAVDSESTSKLMTSFHRHRKQNNGVSTGEALRSAQLEMLAGSNESYRHPYHWAPFSVIGGYARF